MSCCQCAKKFSLFNREIGCGNCGFGFCSKCCSYKINVPKKDNKRLNVCFKCNDSITNNKKEPITVSPPKNFLKLVEKNKIKNQNAPTEDTIIAKRLENLQNGPNIQAKSIPTEKELETRLKLLQGEGQSKPLSNLPGKDLEKTSDDLIKKFKEEVAIEKTAEDYENEQLKKLEDRLKNLESKNKNVQSELKTSPTDMSEPKAVDPAEELMKKFLLEAEESDKKSKISEEDTWCCLCNDDGKLKCFDCDDDLFCTRCYKQTHNTGEYKRHQYETVSFAGLI